MNINNPTTFGTPALVYSTSNSSGTGGALRADDTLAIFSATVPTNVSTSTVSASTGDNAFGSREDHVHGSTAIIAAASVAEMEAASSTTVWASPGRVQNAPGVSKAYLRIATDGASFSGSYNVASVTDTAVGTRVIVITTDFSDTAYSVVTTLADEHNRIVRHASFNVGSVNLYINALSSAHNYEGADSATSTSLFGDQ